MSLNILNKPFNLSERYALLRSELEEVKADIVTFQEVLEVGFQELKLLMNDLGYIYEDSAFGATNIYQGVEYYCGNATFSKTPIIKTQVIDFEGIILKRGKTLPHSIISIVELPEGKKVCVINNHLSWSAENEYPRKQQLELLVKETNNIEADITIMSGDFNSLESTDTMRYMRGETYGSEVDDYTFWVDAYLHKGTPDEYHTTGPSLPFSVDTAYRAGIIAPEEIPERRIDYILVKGWVYGRVGSPLSYGRVDTTGISDHYGIYSDLML